MADVPLTDLLRPDPHDAHGAPLHCPECLKGIGVPVNVAKGIKLVVITASCENCGHKWTVQRQNFN